jgi:hypothetical protein
MLCGGTTGPGTLAHGGATAPPSTISAGAAHAMPGLAEGGVTHVQVDGQSASVVQPMARAWHIDTPVGIATHPLLGAEPASSAGAGALIPVGGMASPPSAETTPPPPLEPAPPQQASSCSATHLKWSPQSESVVQGKSYLGMQALGATMFVHEVAASHT